MLYSFSAAGTSNAYGDVAKNVKMPPEMESQMARTSLRSILKQVAKSITPADVQQLNAALNKIKKENWSICEVELSLNGTLREIFSFGEGRAAFDRFLPSMCVMAEAQRYRPLWA